MEEIGETPLLVMVLTDVRFSNLPRYSGKTFKHSPGADVCYLELWHNFNQKLPPLQLKETTEQFYIEVTDYVVIVFINTRKAIN